MHPDQSKPMPMKLEGIRVIDLSVNQPGPYLTLMMADHGADVIKVEPPGGDPIRRMEPHENGEGVVYRNLNRGKKSIVLNLKHQPDHTALMALCKTADVLVESFRPGVLERLGVGYEAIRRLNPRIVYCSITAYGQTGPYRLRPAHDLALEALAGVTSLTVAPDGRLAFPGLPTSNYLASLHGLSGVLMALLRREATGLGDFVDISMHDATLSALGTVAGPALAENRQPDPAYEAACGGLAFYQIYETRDGRHLVLAGAEPPLMRALLDELGGSGFLESCMENPGPVQAPATAFLRRKFRERDLPDWVALLDRLNLCFAPVNFLPEALDDPQANARGMVLVAADGRRSLNGPIRFAAEPGVPHTSSPGVGEHTEEILARLQRTPIS